ncbi:hypothetical protein [Neptunicella sp. SCSIO 80796]|uniref:hypothetical protein n=1 Tax=Neptunicella plasticusilytica TaxID=3117012 RepID=UPI003A4DE61F
MRKRLFILMATIAIFAAQPTLASTEDSKFQEDSMAISIVETKQRLELSAEQEVKFSPVLDQHIKQRSALLDKYGLNQESSSISLRNLRNFRNEMLTLSEQTRDKVAEILNDEQLKEWDSIQQENRVAMRQSFSWQ